MRKGKGLFFDLSERSRLSILSKKWDDRVETISAHCDERPADLGSMLIRPDGYVAWAVGLDDEERQSERTLAQAS
jgi:hypothetical protein